MGPKLKQDQRGHTPTRSEVGEPPDRAAIALSRAPHGPSMANMPLDRSGSKEAQATGLLKDGVETALGSVGSAGRRRVALGPGPGAGRRRVRDSGGVGYG